MPTRRHLELAIVVVVLMQPILASWRVWSAKHLATSDNSSTGAAAEVALNVL